jgi:CobQ-like glutamine amidotransferase family enzyme
MAVGQHEAVAVGPLRIGRVVAQVAGPQHFGDFRHAHRGARVAGIGLLHPVHGERANGIGKIGTHGRVQRRLLKLSWRHRNFE